MSWCTPQEYNYSGIYRCAQTGEGLFGNQSMADEKYLFNIAQQNADKQLFVLDLRSQKNALANKAGGGGYEEYSFVQIEWANIANIHGVRGSYEKMEQAVANISYNKPGSWHYDVGNSSWYDNLSSIMQAAAKIALKLTQKQSVLIHCSDGWDRTAQNTTLVMLALDPYYRTIEGFFMLIQKEWCNFGHKFKTRMALGEKVTSEYCPVFFQWLEAVYQFAVVQYPDEFEFNEDLLLDL